MTHSQELKLAIKLASKGKATPEVKIASKLYESKKFDTAKIPSRKLHYEEPKLSTHEENGLTYIKVEHKNGTALLMHTTKPANEALDSIKELEPSQLQDVLSTEFIPLKEEQNQEPKYKEDTKYDTDAGTFTVLSSDDEYVYLTDPDNEPIQMPMDLWEVINPRPSQPAPVESEEDPLLEDATQTTDIAVPTGTFCATYKKKDGTEETIKAMNEEQLEELCAKVEEDPEFDEFTDFYEEEASNPDEDPLYNEEEEDPVLEEDREDISQPAEEYEVTLYLTDMGVVHEEEGNKFTFIDNGDTMELSDEDFLDLNPIPLIPDETPLQVVNESVVIRGNEKYFARGGKFYHYDAEGTRTEISGEEYKAAVGPKKYTAPEVGTKAQNKNSAAVTINGKKYTAMVDGMSGKEVADKFDAIAKHSPGRAIQWIKKNGTLTQPGSKTPVKKTHGKGADK